MNHHNYDFLTKAILLFTTVVVLSHFPGLHAQTQKLEISDNGRFLIEQDGTPFVWIGETNRFFAKLPPATINSILDARSRQGFAVMSVSQPLIEEIFLRLPDSAFYLRAEEYTLSREDRERMLKSDTWEKARALIYGIAVDSLRSMRKELPLIRKPILCIDTSETSDGYLSFYRIAADDGLTVTLKTWPYGDGTVVVAVKISRGDMVADWSEIEFYHYADGAFERVTDRVFPKFELDDFAVSIGPRAREMLSGPLEYSVYLEAGSDTLQVSIHNTPMIFDFYYSHDLDDELELKDDWLKLVWTGEKFVLNE